MASYQKKKCFDRLQDNCKLIWGRLSYSKNFKIDCSVRPIADKELIKSEIYAQQMYCCSEDMGPGSKMYTCWTYTAIASHNCLNVCVCVCVFLMTPCSSKLFPDETHRRRAGRFSSRDFSSRSWQCGCLATSCIVSDLSCSLKKYKPTLFKLPGEFSLCQTGIPVSPLLYVIWLASMIVNNSNIYVFLLFMKSPRHFTLH